MLNEIKLKNIIVSYEIEKRKVKHPRMEFKTGYLRLILPENYFYHEELLIENQDWILKQYDLINLSKNYELNLNRTESELKRYIFILINKYCSLYDLTINTISYRKMKKRWGSCDSKNNLKFNKNLKYLPTHLIDYVVFHEITHLKELNHGKNFYNHIKRKYPNYKKLDEELTIAWFAINVNSS